MGVDAVTLTGPRVETYWVNLLDAEDNLVRPMMFVAGGRVEQNYDRLIRGGCSLTIHESSIDWMTARFQPWVRVNTESWPLGVFLASEPDEVHWAGGEGFEVRGLDKLSVLDEDKIEETLSAPAGSVALDLAIQQIHLAGEYAITYTDSSAQLREAIVWPAGTSRLSIVDSLMQAINYNRVWADGWGRYRLEPFVNPADRPPVWTFQPGELAIHSPEWKRQQNITGIPNKVILTTSGDDEQEALRAVASNTNPDSPYSYQARGNRWVVRDYDGVEAVDQPTLDSLAQRYLSNASRAVASYHVSHAPIPLDPMDVVRWRSGRHDVLAEVNEYQIELNAGAMMSSLFTEV